MILLPAVLIALSDRIVPKRRLIWGASSLLPTALAVCAVVLGAYNPHGDVGPFIIMFVGFIGPWLVLLVFKKIEPEKGSGC